MKALFLSAGLALAVGGAAFAQDCIGCFINCTGFCQNMWPDPMVALQRSACQESCVTVNCNDGLGCGFEFD
jgi:hypothetical protein